MKSVRVNAFLKLFSLGICIFRTLKDNTNIDHGFCDDMAISISTIMAIFQFLP